MKKVISIILLLAMCLSLFAGCAKEEGGETEPTVNEALAKAKSYLKTMYKDCLTATYNTDYTMVSAVVIDGTKYPITWSVNVPETDVKVVPGDDGMVTIDINELSETKITYVLTATLTDAEGNTATVDFNHDTMTAKEVLDAAYALADGATLSGAFSLTGVIKSVDTPWSDQYGNVTVTIQVGDYADQPVMCYRLKGDGAADLKIGDTITVTGSIKNYGGTIEFDAGCLVSNIIPGEDAAPEVPVVPEGATQEQIVDIAYTLISGQSLATEHALTGVITSIDTAWDSNYQNITVTIQVGDKSDKLIQCFRMKGEGADTLAVGDTITCTGTLKNYSGTIEFDAGCVVSDIQKAGEAGGDTTGGNTTGGNTSGGNTSGGNTSGGNTSGGNTSGGNTSGGNTSGGNTSSLPSNATAKQIVEAAYKLADGESLSGTYSLTGEITGIKYAWSDQYENISVVMTVEGKEITCFRMVGNGASELKIGDTITCTGTLVNYMGTIEFDAGCTVSNIVKGPEVTPSTLPVSAVTLTNGMKVVIYAPAYGKALSTEKVANYYNAGVDLTASGKTISGYSDSEIWTVVVNSDGTYSFSNGGQNIGLGDEFSSMSQGAVNDKWELIDLGGGLYMLKNTVRGNYVEWYASKGNWSSYNSDTAAEDDQFQLAFYVVG